jgi:hypothetical protein
MERDEAGGPPIARADLSPDWAFVVHFRPWTLGEGRTATGRVEHVATGRTGHFQSLTELAAFAAQVLGERQEAAGPSVAQGGER